jgi:hypothetical protein
MGISPLRTGVLRPNAKNIIPIQGQFATYCYTPGNLNSYNEQAINQKMFDSYNKLSAKDQSAFVINGEDFSSFYTSQDYCKAIIKRFGFSGVGAEQTLSRLEFAFAETSSRKEEFQSTTAFTDSAGLFVDFSAYVGAYAGEGLEVFGFGEDVGVYAGITATLKTSETTIRKDSKDWGIKLSNYLNSLAPGEAYSVQMYLLKPNPLWAVEAALFGRQKGLDTQASSPIRIMFIVPYVSPTLKARLKTVFPA